MGKGIILGIDFSMDFTQIAYLENDVTPKTISVRGEDHYQIPSMVCYNKELMEWSAGEEAESKGRLNNSVLYKNLPLMCGKEMSKDDREVVTVFLEYILEVSKKFAKVDSVRDVVVSVDELTPIMQDNLIDLFVELGFEKEQIRVLSHTESFVYFVLYQNSDIWVNDVYLVNYNKYDFSCRKLSVMKNRKPYVVDVAIEDLSFIENKVKEKNVMLETEMSDDALVQLDKGLSKYLGKEVKENVVSSIYLVGQGFIDFKWDNTIKEICDNRRVFQGNNLFVKGAAYAAREIFHIPQLDDFLISCEGRTRVKITMSLKHKERDNAVALSNIGDYWYNARSKIECIMEEPTIATFEIHDIINKKIENFEIDLTDFPARPRKTTRIEVGFKYLNEKEIQIEIKDLGFGEFYEPTDKSVTKTLTI